MFQHETQLRVRYAETDQMGFVYYGQYATYFEVARVEALRSLGCTYRALEDSGVLMPVTQFQISYKKPALYDELLSIVTQIKQLPGVRIRFDYATYNPEGTLLNEAFTELVFLDATSRRVRKAPETLIHALQSFFQDGI